ncbi:MAG: cytochrome [Leptolyngbya sp. SIO4C1]|nr:cytochrome [Leptolyngbya sp. SIO4C1]
MQARRPIIGVMGPGETASAQVQQTAFELGQQIARHNWVLLTGGRNAGVMDAASRGAALAGGLTLGILPGTEAAGLSDYVSVPILTGLGNARNGLNVLTSQVVVACGLGPGTVAEVALALKAGRPVVLLQMSELAVQFFQSLTPNAVTAAETVEAAIAQIQSALGSLSD